MQTTDPNEHQTPLYVACPFFGSLDDRTTRALFPSETSGCFSDLDRDAISVKLEHQAEYCLSLCHTSCPRFLGSTEPNASTVSSKSTPLVKVGRRVYVVALVALIALMGFASWRVWATSSAVAAPETNLGVAALHTIPIEGTKGAETVQPDASDVVADSADTEALSAAENNDVVEEIAEIVPERVEDSVESAEIEADEPETVPDATVEAVADAVVEADTSVPAIIPDSADADAPEPDEVTDAVAGAELILRVREPGANLRAAPGTANEVLAIVPAASEVVALGRTRDFWFFVELPDGLKGWVAFSTVDQVAVEAVRELPLISTQ
jgi:hypothetical protein